MTSNPYKKGKLASESEDSSADVVKALQYHVHKICERRIQEDKKNIVMSKDAVNALTEFTYHYATTCLANDLVMFSQHRKSKTVNADDVKLVARKDPSRLGAHLERCHMELIEKQEQSKKKKSKNKVKVKDVHSSQDEHLKKMEGMNAMQKRDYLMNAAKSSSESEEEDSSLEDRIIFRQKPKSGIIRIDSDSDSNGDDVERKRPKRSEQQFHVQVMSSSSSSSDDDSDVSSSASIDDKKPRAR